MCLYALHIIPWSCLDRYVNATTFVTSTVTKFQNVLSDIDAECQSIREQAELYSDGEDLTDADLTQAIALHNSLSSIRKLFEAINAKSVNRKS